MPTDPAAMRQNYDRSVLVEADADADPVVQFGRWFEEALAGGLKEPNAMALGTVDVDGRPSVRMVLLKGYDERGFCFYTNTQSRKGQELAGNATCALMFWWDVLHRQVRIEGRAEPVSAAEADAYFASRPHGSQVGAWASPQSRVVPGREAIEAAEREMLARYPAEVPRPTHWSGYRVVPECIEFWQGRVSRLHDRLRYTRVDDAWRIERLAP